MSRSNLRKFRFKPKGVRPTLTSASTVSFSGCLTAEANLISFGSDPLKVPVNNRGELFPNTEKLEEAVTWSAIILLQERQLKRRLCHVTLLYALYVMYVVQQLREQCVHLWVGKAHLDMTE